MKLLTLLCACVLITTGTWAYSRDCAKGPEYWCRDASTAEDCGAVQHCQQTVWNKKENPIATSDTAHMLCNVLAQASSELLTDGSINANSIKEYLREDCNKLPAENNLIQQCQMAVDLYLSDILRHIESGTETSKICSIIQGHDTSNVFIPKPKPLDLTSNTTCVLCEFIVHILQTFATANASAQELSHILEYICQEMPSVLRDECKQFIEAYGPDMIAILVREFDPAKTCELLKVCPKPKNVAFLIKPSVQACGLCDYVSTYLSAGYPIENVCKHFSTDNNIKQQCEVLVHLYKPNICTQLPICFDEPVITPLEQSIETPIKSAECSLCKYVVSYIDTVVQNNKSEAAIEAALEKVCGILPAPIKAPCITFVDTYGPVLVPLIAKYATPEQVCNALKMCHNGTQELTPIEHTQPIKVEELSLKTVPCLLCKYIIGYLETATANNKSTAAIEAALDKVCNILPGVLKANCTTFVHKYGPLIAILFAKNETAVQICDFLKVCTNGTQGITQNVVHETFKVKQSSINSVECSLCKYVVSYVDNIVQNNKSEAAIEAALEKVCTILPPAIKDKCVQFVETYGPVLTQLIAKYATPEQVCNALKMCHNGTQEMTSFKPAEVNEFIESSIKSAQCSLCKYVVSYIDAVVQNNKSEAAIEAALEKVCGILPAPIKAPCITFVDTYGPILVQLIEKYATPEQVCNALKMCHNGTQEITPLQGSLIQMLKTKQPAIGSPQCSLCKYVVSYIDTVIQNNKSEAAIEAALEKVCGILPAPIRAPCVTFVDTYGPVLVQLIEKYGTPDKVCNALQMCHNGTESTQSIIKNLPKLLKTLVQPKQIVAQIGSPQCSLCKYVVSYIDTVIQNNKSEAAIEAALEKVCGILPAPIKAPCITFVDTYGPVLVQLIEKYGTPDKVCNALQMCHNGTESTQSITKNLPKLLKTLVQPKKVIAQIGSPQCSLCKYIVNYIDTVIQNNKSEAAIEAALEKVCGILPAPIKAPCITFVDTYGPVLVQLIEKYGTADKVCNALQMCHNGTQVTESTSQNIMQAIKKVKKGDECVLCKYILSYINLLVKSNATEQELEKALELVCGILPAADRETCDKLVHQYGPIVVELVAELDDPNEICKWLGLCPKSDNKFVQIPAIKSNKLKSLPCNLCQYLVNYLDAIIQSNSTETRFEHALDDACKILHVKTLESECKTLVHLYGADLIKFLVEYGDPKVVCQAIGICEK